LAQRLRRLPLVRSGVVGAALAALGWRRPLAVRVPELALDEVVVEAVRLLAQQPAVAVHLVLARVGRPAGAAVTPGGPGRAGLGPARTAAQQPPQEAHRPTPMNASVSAHARSDASAKSVALRSKKLCGAPS